MEMWRAIPMILFFALGAACGGAGERTDPVADIADAGGDSQVRPEGPRQLEILGGNLQSGFHGEVLEDPLVVRLVDADGVPVAGAEVLFELRVGMGLSSASDATLAPEIAVTDADGRAQATLTLGEESGLAIVQVGDADHLAPPVLLRSWSYHPPDATHRPLCVLEINDFHMRLLPMNSGGLRLGGLARIAWLFKTVRANNDRKGIPTIIVNTGDDMENTMFHDAPGNISLLYEVYDAIGVDVTQVGNHDYHFGIPFLDDQIDAAAPSFTGALQGHPMRFLWGNVDPATLFEPFQHFSPLFETDFSDPGDGAGVRYNQTVVLDVEGLTVGILGVTTDAAIFTQVAGDPDFYKLIGAPSEFSEGLTFFDPDPAGSDYIGAGIDALDAEGADVLLLASHAGLGFGDRVNIPPGKDELIATQGIGPASGRSLDLILSGHSHVRLNHGIAVGNPAGGETWIVQAREAGLYVGAVALEVDPTSDQATVLDAHLIQVDGTLPDDPQTAARVDEARGAVVDLFGEAYDTVVARLGVTLSHRSGAHCGLGQIISDAFRWKLDAAGIPCDVAMAVPSMYRGDLVRGVVTEDEVFDVLPLHNLDDEGVNDEPLVILELLPGLHDWSVLGLESTKKPGLLTLHYILEFFHSLEMLDEIYEGASAEFKLDVMQLSGFSYRIDSTAPPFQRIVPESLRIGGAEADPSRTYRLAVPHSIGANVAAILNFIMMGTSEDGSLVRPMVLHGEHGEPYVDTGVLAWEALRDWMIASLDPATATIPENAVVNGERFRTVEPDLTVDPTEITWTPSSPAPGEAISLHATVRNLGETPVSEAVVTFFLESTPWDRTDDDDGRLALQGFPETFTGSLIRLGATTVALGAWPETATATISWTVPQDAVPYDYPIVARISGVEGALTNPHTGAPYQEVVRGNNHGPDQQRALPIR